MESRWKPAVMSPSRKSTESTKSFLVFAAFVELHAHDHGGSTCQYHLLGASRSAAAPHRQARSDNTLLAAAGTFIPAPHVPAPQALPRNLRASAAARLQQLQERMVKSKELTQAWPISRL
jgi:hypothetical protein